MMNISELHNKAMDLAELATLTRLRGEIEHADELTRQAYELEKQTAEIYANDFPEEPTRSVLYRSAASLALECGDARSAQKLIIAGLSGEPPAEIEDELKDLFEQVNFARHLELRGIDLAPVEVQLAISGKSIGYGMAPAGLFMDRIANTRTLLRRTAERRRNMPFHEKGKTADIIKQDSEIYLSPLRAACLAVTFRVGQPIEQLPLFGDENSAAALIDEFLYCLDAFNKGEDAELEKHIGNDAYYANFIGLAHNIVPDGEEVSLVGFTAMRDGVERRVAITRKRNESPKTDVTGSGDGEVAKTEVVRGTLKYASAINKNTIKVQQQENGKNRTIIVPEGLMNDIVKPLWDSTVEIEVSVKGKELHLKSIREIED